MMSEDYGLLDAVRDVLSTNEVLQSAGVHQRVYLKPPLKPIYPCLFLEIDSVWQDPTASDNQAIARINFHVNLLSQSHMGATPAHIGQSITTCLDARSIRLSPVFLANFRKTGNVIDLPMMHSPRLFQQFYQAIVWRKNVASNEEAM
jgi:hypothetical protein